ncbi:MAG: hypothetical protein ACRC67_00955 [Inquilinus sp.]|uniref:hypothetical protein n=1 Tax=Inquilinus sp. TaxID=1932117 RepID=UPI003F2D4BED
MTGRGHAGETDLAALTTFLAGPAATAPSHYAFVRRGKVLCFFADSNVALEAGARSFRDREFSVIDVAARKVILPH